MLVWFGTLGGLGIWHIAHNPAVLAALSPVHAVQFLGSHGMKGFAVLGSVVLCITGGEALYADMGHFGARPIRLAWLGVVMPALVLAYFGQGAHILANPAATHNPFFSLVASGPFTYVLVALATAATVIASQALISGAYSLTHQAVQLGLFPRVTVQHTSADAAGQIYIPEINWFLALACIGLVLLFQSSGELAAAYGIAVCGTMAITSILYFLVAHHNWQWPLHRSLPLLALFLTFDLGFLGANLLKFHDGGYVPLVIGFGLFLVMAVWYVGRSHLAAYMARRSPSWQDFGRHLIAERILRPSGVGVFMASGRAGVPPMMVHQAERIGVLPQTALLLTIEFQRVPHVPEQERLLELEGLGHGFTRVVARYGFMDEPDVPRLIGAVLRRLGVQVPPGDITYYLGRETFVAGQRGRMGTLSESFFQFLSRNARSATIYFHLPPEQVVELGVQIDL
jgi:KUP system potassium uptake protein